MIDRDALTRSAIALYGKFARISDPGTLEYRWDRLKDVQKQDWISQAEITIETYLYLIGER